MCMAGWPGTAPLPRLQADAIVFQMADMVIPSRIELFPCARRQRYNHFRMVMFSSGPKNTLRCRSVTLYRFDLQSILENISSIFGVTEPLPAVPHRNTKKWQRSLNYLTIFIITPADYRRADPHGVGTGFLEAWTFSETWVREAGRRALILEAHHNKHIEGTRLILEWVMSNEWVANWVMPVPQKRVRYLRHNLRQTHDSTCDTPFGKVSGKMGCRNFRPAGGHMLFDS